MTLRCGVIKDEEDKETLQSDLDKLIERSDKWLLKFCQEKCKVMFIGEDTKEKYILTNEAGSHSLKKLLKKETSE